MAIILGSWEETKAGKIKNMLEGLNIPSGLGAPRDPPPQKLSHPPEKRTFLLHKRQRDASTEAVKLSLEFSD